MSEMKIKTIILCALLISLTVVAVFIGCVTKKWIRIDYAPWPARVAEDTQGNIPLHLRFKAKDGKPFVRDIRVEIEKGKKLSQSFDLTENGREFFEENPDVQVEVYWRHYIDKSKDSIEKVFETTFDAQNLQMTLDINEMLFFIVEKNGKLIDAHICQKTTIEGNCDPLKKGFSFTAKTPIAGVGKTVREIVVDLRGYKLVEFILEKETSRIDFSNVTGTNRPEVRYYYGGLFCVITISLEKITEYI